MALRGQRFVSGGALGLVVAMLCASSAWAKPGEIFYGDSSRSEVRKIKANGSTELISDDSRLAAPSDVVFDRKGKLYVTDYNAVVGNDVNAVFKINPKTGKTSKVFAGEPLSQPDGIALAPNGHLLVSDLDAEATVANPDGGALFDIDPKTKQIRTLASGPLMQDALGVATDPSGNLAFVGLSGVDRVSFVKISTKAKGLYADPNGSGSLAGTGAGTLFSSDGNEVAKISPSKVVAPLSDAPEDATGYGIGLDFDRRVLFATGESPSSIVAYENNAAPDPIATLPANSFAEGMEVQPPSCDGLTATIVGSNKSETIHGSSYPDVIAGLGGSDTLKGFGGDDVICGGDGEDKIKGGDGKDTIRGQSGLDDCSGGPGRNDVEGC